MCYSMAEIEEQELREAKRACNFIWAAAENYELEPLCTCRCIETGQRISN